MTSYSIILLKDQLPTSEKEIVISTKVSTSKDPFVSPSNHSNTKQFLSNEIKPSIKLQKSLNLLDDFNYSSHPSLTESSIK